MRVDHRDCLYETVGGKSVGNVKQGACVPQSAETICFRVVLRVNTAIPQTQYSEILCYGFCVVVRACTYIDCFSILCWFLVPIYANLSTSPYIRRPLSKSKRRKKLSIKSLVVLVNCSLADTSHPLLPLQKRQPQHKICSGNSRAPTLRSLWPVACRASRKIPVCLPTTAWTETSCRILQSRHCGSEMLGVVGKSSKKDLSSAAMVT